MAAVFGFLGGWFSQSVFESDSPSASSPDTLATALFPEEGVNLDVRWDDIPLRLVEEGVIDLKKFKAAAQRAGSPLTPDQLKLLTEGSDEPVTFDADNAYFMLDVLWALGLANKTTVLTEGPIAQQGWDQAGGYAGTGAKLDPDLVPMDSLRKGDTATVLFMPEAPLGKSPVSRRWG